MPANGYVLRHEKMTWRVPMWQLCEQTYTNEARCGRARFLHGFCMAQFGRKGSAATIGGSLISATCRGRSSANGR